MTVIFAWRGIIIIFTAFVVYLNVCVDVKDAFIGKLLMLKEYCGFLLLQVNDRTILKILEDV